jgi:hypothetical protein
MTAPTVTGIAGDLPLAAGDRYRLLNIATGPEASEATSAEGYRLWYRIIVPDAGRGLRASDTLL